MSYGKYSETKRISTTIKTFRKVNTTRVFIKKLMIYIFFFKFTFILLVHTHARYNNYKHYLALRVPPIPNSDK